MARCKKLNEGLLEELITENPAIKIELLAKLTKTSIATVSRHINSKRKLSYVKLRANQKLN
jgi:Fic family protein